MSRKRSNAAYKEVTGSLELKEPKTAAEREDNPNEVRIILERGNEYPDGTPWGDEDDEQTGKAKGN